MQLIIGVLFISISATVTPQSLRHLVLPSLGLTAVLVIVARPLTAFASTLRTDLGKSERAFVGWMAPRGIVAAATASTFTAGLVAKGIDGAAKILPVTFLVIVVTVTVYELLAAATGRGARLEEITAVLLLTDEDDFNALASVLLADCVDGRVYRLAPPQRSQGVVAPYTGGEILFGDGMTRPTVNGRYHDGARITAQHAGGVLPAGHDVLFLVRADGQLTAVTQTDTPVPEAGDTIVFLGPVPVAQPVDGRSQR